MRRILLGLMLGLAGPANAALVGKYFTTSNILTDSSGAGNTLCEFGTPASNTSPCVNVGTYNMGPTSASAWPESQGGCTGLNTAFTARTSFGVGGYVYASTFSTYPFPVNWSDLSTTNMGIQINSSGQLLGWYGNGSTLAGPTLSINTCYYVGVSSDGTNFYLWETTGTATSPVASVAYTGGTGTPTYIQFGRYIDAGSDYLTGYLNDVTFWTNCPTAAPFDSAVATATPTPIAATPTNTPLPTATPSFTVSPTPTITAATKLANLAPSPPMGFQTYNAYGCAVTAANLTTEAAALDTVTYGGKSLAQWGYQYIDMDSSTFTRNGNGILTWQGTYFPNNLSPVASTIHALGHKFGVYVDGGTTVCGCGSPGSVGYESVDAATIAPLADEMKMDFCYSVTYTAQTEFTIMGNAVIAQGFRTIFDVCEYGWYSPWNWAQPFATSWRTTTDIEDNWTQIDQNFYNTATNLTNSGPNGYAYPGELEVGQGGCTATQYQGQFDLWVALFTPLIFNTTPDQLTSGSLAVLCNYEVLPLNAGANWISNLVHDTADDPNTGAGSRVWYRPIQPSGTYLVLLENYPSSGTSFTVNWSNLGGSSGTGYVRDPVAHSNVGTYTTSWTQSVAATSAPIYVVSFNGYPGYSYWEIFNRRRRGP